MIIIYNKVLLPSTQTLCIHPTTKVYFYKVGKKYLTSSIPIQVLTIEFTVVVVQDRTSCVFKVYFIYLIIVLLIDVLKGLLNKLCFLFDSLAVLASLLLSADRGRLHNNNITNRFLILFFSERFVFELASLPPVQFSRTAEHQCSVSDKQKRSLVMVQSSMELHAVTLQGGSESRKGN